MSAKSQTAFHPVVAAPEGWSCAGVLSRNLRPRVSNECSITAIAYWLFRQFGAVGGILPAICHESP